MFFVNTRERIAPGNQVGNERNAKASNLRTQKTNREGQSASLVFLSASRPESSRPGPGPGARARKGPRQDGIYPAVANGCCASSPSPEITTYQFDDYFVFRPNSWALCDLETYNHVFLCHRKPGETSDIRMPYSHHSHSGQFCPGHARNTLEEMIQAAIAKKMSIFALTEHMPRDELDFYAEEVNMILLQDCCCF